AAWMHVGPVMDRFGLRPKPVSARREAQREPTWLGKKKGGHGGNMVSPARDAQWRPDDLPRLRQVRARRQDLRARAAARRPARRRAPHARLGGRRARADHRVPYRADNPRRDGPGGGGERRDRGRRRRARASPRRGRRPGPARPRRPPAARGAAARGDDDTARRLQALLSDPRLTEDLPPGLDSPGVRERFARLKIDVSPLREFPNFRWFWLGQAAKDLGGGVVQVALPFQIYQLTGPTLSLAAPSVLQ